VWQGESELPSTYRPSYEKALKILLPLREEIWGLDDPTTQNRNYKISDWTADHEGNPSNLRFCNFGFELSDRPIPKFLLSPLNQIKLHFMDVTVTFT
jgi:hypothetical protein